MISTKSSGSSNEATLLLLTGGWDENSRIASTEVFPATSGCSPPNLPGKRSAHTTFLTAGDRAEIATCGGYDGDALSSCLVLDTSTGQWEENRMGTLLQERGDHAAVTLLRQVYLIGGGPRGSSSRTTEVLPAGNTSWLQGPQLPVEMLSPCAVAISATGFLVFYEKEIIEFDVSTAGPVSIQGWAEEGKWPKLETSRKWWPGCVKLGNEKVVIAGGLGSSTHQTTEILDLSTRTLSTGGKMATPRRWFHIVRFNTNGTFRTLALGGFDGGESLNSVEEWQSERESWSTVETRLKEKKNSFGVVAVDKNLVCPSQ